ncbi:MAG TPA: TIM-barrel domain-containing protein, partial [Chloroflexota bacterium]|nr:TIM-barrel domain-containing protein [Chloroflexota bacterium]
ITVGRSDNGLRIVYDAEGGAVDFYFLVGNDVRDVMNEVGELLGRPPLPPRWYLGYLQSTRHFESTDELRQLPRDLRAKQIPCDGLIFLSTYGDALGWNRMVGHLEFQPELWNDPAALLAEMTEQHFAVITHEYPVLHPEAPGFDEASQKGYLLAEGYPKPTVTDQPNAVYQAGQRYIDFSNPDARHWWWQEHAPLRELGVAGWWLDGGEGPPSTSQLQLGRGEALHNSYDVLRHQAFAEGEATDRPDLRPVMLCRSGAAGMQRLGASCWSGDIDNTFATFRAQIPLGLNLGLSGVPYWGTDVGGFFHPVPETGELFARWFQFGAFCPIFRSHGRVWREHLPWSHGGEVEAICRRYCELRYQLLPYTDALAWQAHTLGLPLMRPLCLNYPDDPRTWDLGDEYLWGDDLLVAPVTREGARTWTVYLPEGAWYDFWTQECYRGPGGVQVDAPLDRLPLFVRAGAIVPLGPILQFADERPLDEVTVLIYPGPDSHFELYDDDGRTNAYRQGAFAITRLGCRHEVGQTIVEVADPDGDRSVIPTNRTYTLQIYADRPSRVIVDEQGPLSELSDASRSGAGWWTERGFLWVRLAQGAGRVILED